MSLFFKLNTTNDISFTDYNEVSLLDEDKIKKSNNLLNKINNKKKTIDKNSFFYQILSLHWRLNDINYLNFIFNIDYKSPDYGFIRANYENGKLEYYLENSNENCLLTNCVKKYKLMIQTMVSDEMHNKFKEYLYCERQSILFEEYYYKVLSFLFDVLEENGSLFISFFSICNNQQIEYIYILSVMFNSVIIYNGNYVYCSGFKLKNSKIKKKDIENIIKKKISIQHKNQLTELIKYYEFILDNNNILYQLYLDEKYDEYLNIYFSNIYRLFNYEKLIELSKDAKTDILKELFTYFKRVFINNEVVKINSSINKKEGDSISNLIKEYNLTKCLEIGLAFGISAIYILSNKNTSLTSIDPFQKTQWKNYGLKLIQQLNYDNRHKLIKKKSYEALPRLLKKKGEAHYDFIFIDGWHTFDYTLVDFFYANLLLKNNGIIVIDDAMHKGVSECVRYLEKNYQFYKKIPSINTIAVFQKIGDDTRDWNFHVSI